LVSVVAALTDHKPIRVGASMGGATSLVAIGEGQLDGLALVLVDIAPRIEVEGVAKIREFMGQNPNGFASLEEVAEAIASYQPHRRRPPSLDGLAKNVRLGDDGRYRWHWDPRTRAQESNLDERRIRLEQCTRNLRVPALLIRGALSNMVSEEGAQEFLDLCPHGQHVNVADAVHMVAGDRNDIFVGAVVDFLLRSVPVESRQSSRESSSTEGDAADLDRS